jgi:hypothetical protein
MVEIPLLTSAPLFKLNICHNVFNGVLGWLMTSMCFVKYFTKRSLDGGNALTVERLVIIIQTAKFY